MMSSLGKLTANDKSEDKEWHDTSFGVVHVVAITNPFFGFCAWLAFFASRVPTWDQLGAEVVDQVLDDGTSFSDDDWRAFRALDGDDW